MLKQKRDLHGFTLIELLVVVAIIAILLAILLPSMSMARETARKVSCASNLQQISKALQMYADDYNDLYPSACIDPTWDIDRDDPTNTLNPKMGWMRRLFGYLKDRNIYKCPSFLRPQTEGEFHYFLGARAAYARAAYAEWKRNNTGFKPNNCRISVRRSLIEYPSAHVLGGDCNRIFARWDCDRDDFTQQCLGWTDVVAAEPDRYWNRWHKGGLNVIFADAHVNWYTKFTPNAMTFSYNDYKNWEEALPAEAISLPE
jgi:prepilin-type N-terminal cleavage/methylation domain-containing protein/prepilin-type processing-associated H-X9-DG protein